MTQTQDARHQAAATILAGMMTSPKFDEGSPTPMVEFAWDWLARLEAAAPTPSGNPGALRVEPIKADWEEAAVSIPVNQPSWQYYREVSRKAYRLAAEREAKG